MEDTSLEDFLDAGDESSEAESEHSETASDAADISSEAEPEPQVADSPEGVESTDDRVDVEPTDVTASWTAGGACCDACGNDVERRWTDGETAVCSACKNWE